MFIIQISINLNASLYANGVVRLDSPKSEYADVGAQARLATKFSVSEQAARVPQLTFLVCYAFGCES
jgi:hypothetical protein